MSKMYDNSKVKATIDSLLDMFTNPDSLLTVAKSMFRRNTKIPSDNWSVLNRIIMFLHGTNDARSFNAWKSVGRSIKAGEHAFYIIKPRVIQIPLKDKDGNPILDENSEEKKEIKVVGFLPTPEFAVEQTDGKPVDYGCDETMPEFKGIEVAKKWGITVSQGFANPSYYGFYNPEQGKIEIATPNQQTFFHELCHASDDKVLRKMGAKMVNGENAEQEIVAEFSACVLMMMCGLKAGTGNTYSYIKSYASNKDKPIGECVIPLINRISRVIDNIMKEMENV